MKIVVGGQLRKQEIANYINNHYPAIQVDIKSDMDAAFAIQNQEYDFYLGACDTGGGGALAMAVSILGVAKTATIATQSTRKSPAEITAAVASGVIDFGFVESEWEYCTNNILQSIGGLKHG